MSQAKINIEQEEIVEARARLDARSTIGGPRMSERRCEICGATDWLRYISRGRWRCPRWSCNRPWSSGRVWPGRDRAMRAGFVGSRETVLVAIARMGAASCSYSIGEWVRRCDCKYGVADAKTWPTFGERGNGCPELRSLWTIVDALTDDEWSLLTRRAGGIPSGSLFRTADIASRRQAAVRWNGYAIRRTASP